MRGTHVLVAGAGLAGLAAARDLEHRGARVTVVDARDRVGGRVWTIRDGFGGQQAEAGADLIEEPQREVLALAKSLGLRATRILRHGFGFHGLTRRGTRGVQRLDAHAGEMLRPFAESIRDYAISERRWDSAIARALSGQSAAGLLARAGAPEWVRARLRGLRGLFLADPDELSALAVVDFFEEMGTPGQDPMYRIAQGNDSIATRIAQMLQSSPRLETVLRRIRQTRRGITATLETGSGQAEIAADYVIVAIPAITARDVVFDPDLPDRQQDALAALRYGAATRVLLQFEDRFWNKLGRPTAFGTDGPLGAVWDGNEQQRTRSGILTVLAGGDASRELQAIVRVGVAGVLPHLKWLGRPARLLQSRQIVWEADPWARGGYAYFHVGFDPLLREWLARPSGRVCFAGEHTSLRWQGYMNGAVESGLRAAAEVAALARK